MSVIWLKMDVMIMLSVTTLSDHIYAPVILDTLEMDSTAQVGHYISDDHHCFCIPCADVDECSMESHTCHQNADCTNTIGSHNCTCNIGYNGNGITCGSLLHWY